MKSFSFKYWGGLIFLIFLSILSYYTYRINTRNIVQDLSQEKKLINILLAGNHNYNRNKHKFFAVLSFNPENNNVGLIFIPPNLRVFLDNNKNIPTKIEDISLKKISDIKSTLREILGLDVIFYIELYDENVRRIINLLEGLDFFCLDNLDNLEKDLYLNFGLNYLDGNKILKYINEPASSFGLNKYDRIQDVFFTLYFNKEKKKHLFNLDFITELVKDLDTNLLPNEIFSLIKMVYAEGNFFAKILPGKIEEDWFIFDRIGAEEYRKEFLNKIILKKDPASKIRVRVLNGTKIPKLARKMRNSLDKEGLKVVEFGTFRNFLLPKSIIISQKADCSMTKKISELTGIDRIFFKIDSSLFSDILIIVGQDFTPPR